MPAKVARVCDESQCTELLVRGDKISFVSLEQAESVGCDSASCDLHLNDRKMPSDIDMIPASYVLVHDTESAILPKCQLFILKARKIKRVGGALPKAVKEYFGNDRPRATSVELPGKRWSKVCKVRFIRYTRYGVAPDPENPDGVIFAPGGSVPYEHGFQPPADLYVCKKTGPGGRAISWKLSLPDNCILTSHGLEFP